VEVAIDKEPVADGVAVCVQVRLTGREANQLFLKGDTLIHLPVDDAVPRPGDPPVQRVSIFLSELAAEREGLRRWFVDEDAANRFARRVHDQLMTALEAS
jgi:hypothetical protein